MLGDDLITTNQIIYSNNDTAVKPILNKTTEYNFFISSNSRDVSLYPTASEFTICLPDPLNNIISLKMCNISVIRNTDIIPRYNLLEWEYLDTHDHIPIESINTIKKIDKYFKLIRVLYGYTRTPIPVEKGILFSFKSNCIIIQLLGSDDAGYYDLFKLLNPCIYPLKVRFISVDSEIEFSCMVKDIQEFDTSGGEKLKKIYKLFIQGDYQNTSFQNCVENQGHILMYIYNPVTEATTKYIPSYYSNNNYLIDYDDLLRNPKIHNHVIFGVDTPIDLKEFLSQRYLKTPKINITDLPMIDIPKPSKRSIFIAADSLLSCKKCIEESICEYNNRIYVWKCDFEDYLLISHYQILDINPVIIGTKNFITHDDLTEFSVIRIQNAYYSIRKEVDNKYYFYNYRNAPLIKPILLLQPCLMKDGNSSFFTNLGVSNNTLDMETSVWDNFNYSPPIAVEKIFISGLSNNLILQTASCKGLLLGDRVSINNLKIKNTGVLYENIPKFIGGLNIINDNLVFITINLGTFYMDEYNLNDITEIGQGGNLRKIIPFKEPRDKELYVTIPACNYIKTLNNTVVPKVFSILNKDSDFIGGEFKAKPPLKNLYELDIALLYKDGSRATDVEVVNFAFEITQSNTR